MFLSSRHTWQEKIERRNLVFLNKEKQNPKEWVNLKHLREVFIEAGVQFALRVPLFTSRDIWICLIYQMRMAGSSRGGDYTQV